MGDLSADVEPDFFTERADNMPRPSTLVQKAKPFNEGIRAGDFTPAESNFELSTPTRTGQPNHEV